MKKNIMHCLFIALMGFIAYGATAKNGFTWDDLEIIVGNPHIKKLNKENIRHTFASDYFNKNSNYYRPAPGLSYIADYSLWGLNPAGYRLTNILLHSLNAILLFLVVKKLSGREELALFSAVIFSIHPAHSESFGMITARSEALMSFFLLLSALFYIPGGLRGYLLSVFSFIAALFSKETALLFPAVLFFLPRKGEEKRINPAEERKTSPAGVPGGTNYIKGAVAVFPFFAAGIIFYFFRLRILSVGNIRPPNIPGIYRAAEFLFRYLFILIVPVSYRIERTVGAVPPLLSYALIPVLLFLIYAVIKKKKTVSSFALAVFIVPLLPYINTFKILFPIAEHWLYLPAAGTSEIS